MDEELIKEFLECPLSKVVVIEITDGEVTFAFGKELKKVTLYLDGELNEREGFPESFWKSLKSALQADFWSGEKWLNR